LRLLLDTHALIWWMAGAEPLSAAARTATDAAGNTVFVSAASTWEIATKYRIGKLDAVASFVVDIEVAIEEQGFYGLPVSLRHGQLAGELPGPHRDPFDRMLIAQAMLEDMVLVSNEQLFDSYGVRRLW
jgi:PIN domain nuclease of toxin-antitoxin system